MITTCAEGRVRRRHGDRAGVLSGAAGRRYLTVEGRHDLTGGAQEVGAGHRHALPGRTAGGTQRGDHGRAGRSDGPRSWASVGGEGEVVGVVVRAPAAPGWSAASARARVVAGPEPAAVEGGRTPSRRVNDTINAMAAATTRTATVTTVPSSQRSGPTRWCCDLSGAGAGGRGLGRRGGATSEYASGGGSRVAGREGERRAGGHLPIHGRDAPRFPSPPGHADPAFPEVCSAVRSSDI